MRIVHFEKEGVPGIAADDGSGWHGLTKRESGFPGTLPELIVQGADLLHTGRDLLPMHAVDLGAVRILPPVPKPPKILCVGLNYDDHLEESGLKKPVYPEIFGRFATSLIAHQEPIRRPRESTALDYEAELAVVIGKPARGVSREDAYTCIAGYTVANDYAIRDYLENYYRPNLRVKSRDTCTPMGPWLVDAADVPAPMKLALRTSVNGKVTQEGNTRDMIFDIPFLIEYLSGFMTLAPGDVILTGTPEGLVDVKPGDEVVTEIDGVGRLLNTIVGDEAFTPADR